MSFFLSKTNLKTINILRKKYDILHKKYAFFNQQKLELTASVCNGKHYIAVLLHFDRMATEINDIFTNVKIYDSGYFPTPIT